MATATSVQIAWLRYIPHLRSYNRFQFEPRVSLNPYPSFALQLHTLNPIAFCRQSHLRARRDRDHPLSSRPQPSNQPSPPKSSIANPRFDFKTHDLRPLFLRRSHLLRHLFNRRAPFRDRHRLRALQVLRRATKLCSAARQSIIRRHRPIVPRSSSRHVIELHRLLQDSIIAVGTVLLLCNPSIRHPIWATPIQDHDHPLVILFTRITPITILSKSGVRLLLRLLLVHYLTQQQQLPIKDHHPYRREGLRQHHDRSQSTQDPTELPLNLERRRIISSWVSNTT